ncbi:hypothetical protein FHG66_14665 [Rubellimicrobium rubrum]|uniref:Uncharacterized protein n=1 Tax=Rubellimicrobium rubrum TaxID=2585369 RepID=A0A5C4MRG6_9RHOB|nr:hypothetical protein [Rubellimicrobium rubrum]TNC48357.1 hypothetical protein FHG66_14665 [Rubellimicrobium rubrum]
MVHHLVVGVHVGLTSASAALVFGATWWQAALLYILGLNLGLLGSAVLDWLDAGNGPSGWSHDRRAENRDQVWAEF